MLYYFVIPKKNNTFAIAFEKAIGALVQLVRIHACHAWGHGFESRTHRKEKKRVLKRHASELFWFMCHIMAQSEKSVVDS